MVRRITKDVRGREEVPDGKGTNTVPNTFPCLLNHVNNLIASIEKTAERENKK